MTRRGLEEAVLSECEYRVRRMPTDDLHSEFAAIQNGLNVELVAMPSRVVWTCSSCRMEAVDCDCYVFGSQQYG